MKLKVEKVEQALDGIVLKAKKCIAPMGMAASIMASTLTGCTSNTLTNYTEVAAASLTEGNLSDESSLIEALKNYGIDDATINSFKDAVNSEISEGVTFDSTITEKEMLSLGVTFENDGVQLPLWWTGNIENDLRNYRDFITASKTVAVQEANVTKEAVAAESNLEVNTETETVEEAASKHETADQKATKVEIKNFGDATDDAVVTEKATKVADYYNQVGILNLRTGNAYTVEEIKDIILFMNAAYMPEDEADAFTIVDRFLDFVCGPLSSTQTLDMINYMANSDVVTKEMVEEDLSTMPDFDWVDSLLMGDSYCYPYLQWFGDNYNKVMRTTDREEFIKIYNSLTQSLADIMYGDGYTIDEVTYNINNFSGLGDINDGSLLHMFGLMYQVGRVDGVQEDYTVQNRQAGEAIVNIEDILRLLNVECADEIAQKAEYDTEGKLTFPTINGPEQYSETLDNPFMRWETDAIAASLQNLELGNLKAYEDNYNLSLKK